MQPVTDIKSEKSGTSRSILHRFPIEKEKGGDEGPSTSHILVPLRLRDFRLLLGGQMFSTLGDICYAITFPWVLLSGGRSVTELGLVTAAYGLPRIGTLFLGGVLSDRLQPRYVMLFADCIRFLVVALLIVLVMNGHPPLWQLCGIAALLGACTGIFLPASFALMPQVLPSNMLQAGNALNGSALQLATLVGAALAGDILSHLPLWSVLIVDALSFIVSAVTLQLIQGRNLKTADRPSRKLESMNTPHTTTSTYSLVAGSEQTKGLGDEIPVVCITFGQMIHRSQIVQMALIVAVIVNLASGGLMEVALPVFAHRQTVVGAQGYGLMLASLSMGTLLGALSIGCLKLPSRSGLVVLFLIILQAIWFAVVPFMGRLPGMALSLLCAGLANGALNSLFITLVQKIVPSHLLGKTMGCFMFAIFGFYPLSAVLASVATSTLGTTAIFPIGGCLMLLAALFGLSQPVFWRLK